MKAHLPEHHYLSYELYQNFSDDLAMPVDTEIPLEMQYELYISKIVYLKNLMGQCFRIVNSQLDGGSEHFTVDDFIKIQNSFHVTRDLLREIILTKFKCSLESASVKMRMDYA